MCDHYVWYVSSLILFWALGFIKMSKVKSTLLNDDPHNLLTNFWYSKDGEDKAVHYNFVSCRGKDWKHD